jgi:hypothetical protein
MFSALSSESQNAIKRIVVYSACVFYLIVAAVSFVFRGGLQAPEDTPVKRRISGVVAQSQPRLLASYGKLLLSFEANQGQTASEVKFLARGRGYALFLTGDEAVLELRKSSVVSGQLSVGTKQNPRVRTQGPESMGGRPTTDNGRRTNSLTENRQSRVENQVVRLRLVGTKPNAAVTGSEELAGKANYFIGNDPKKWRTNVPTYAKVRYCNVYPGVDLEYYGNQGGQLEYDFIVAPGADPSVIALYVKAVREPPLRIEANGDLVIPAKSGEIRFHKPLIYQPGTGSSLVEGRFALDGRNRVRFALGPYDHTWPLVIDPVLSYSTYLGGSGGDFGSGIAVDSSGNAYVTGQTSSVDFPTAGPLQASLNGFTNAFVSKLNPTGSALIYSTYLGGNGGDSGSGIAVDSAGSVYLAGLTSSTDFPTVNPFQASNNSPTTATGFVAKLNSSGSALDYSTYLGGSGFGWSSGIAVDSSGNAYLIGYTQSTDFPTVNPLQASNKSPGSGNGFVAKLNPSGSALIYSTYLGGSGGDSASGIALDSAGNACVTGYTQSADFPTVNPLQATLNGFSNAFVAELNPAGSALVYSTFLGGSGEDTGTAIAVDSSGSAYVTGYTRSTNFPTVNPLQTTNKAAAAGNTTAFVAELNPAGTALVYSTYLGGSVQDQASGVAVDSSGNAYVVGNTSSKDFPTVNPVQVTNNSAGSGSLGLAPATAFVAELNEAGSALIYSTYLGGSVQDQANAVAVDTSGNAHITGYTASFDFPTVNPLQPANKNAQPSGSTAFVAELSAGPAPALSFFPSVLNFGVVPVNTTSAQLTVTVTNLGNAPLTITGITASGEFAVVTTASSCLYAVQTLAPGANCTVVVTFTPTAPSIRTGVLAVTDNASGSPQTLQLTGNGPISAAVISPSRLEFSGTVGLPSFPATVTLTNRAPVVLTVGSVTVPDDPGEWPQTNNCLPSVGPNASCTINVAFQPTVDGPHEGTLTVTDDASNSPQTVALIGHVFSEGPPSLSPTSLTFGDQAVGTMSAAQTIMLVNPGGYGVPAFSISGDFQQDNSCDNAMSLLGASCPITVWFTPTTAGTRTGALTVTYAPPYPLTLTASLTGIGVSPGVGLSPASLNFPAQTVSTKSPPQVVTLTNAGNAALSPLKITRSGPFAETNNCGGSVAVGASCAISVTFSPIDAGNGSGTLTLTDNAGTQTVPLSGTGLDFAMTSSTTSQTVSAGQTANYSLTLTPEAGFNQTVNLTCTGAPSLATCTLTPSTVTLNGTASTTVAVSISTTASSLAPPQGRFLPPGLTGLRGVLWLHALLGLASVAALAAARNRRAAWLLSAGLLLVVLWSACGGGATQTTTPPSTPGTPAGTYTVDVTATDAAASRLTHTIQYTLTVN